MAPARRPDREDVRAEELSEGDRASRHALQSTSAPTTIVSSRARRTSSGTQTASSPYSTSFRKLTRWSSKSASSSEPGGTSGTRARRAALPPLIQSARPRRVDEAGPRRRDDRRDEHDEHRDVGRADVDRRRADADAELGLVALVDEEERDRRREHECAERVAVDEGCEAPTDTACCRAPRSPRGHYRAARAASDPRRV